MKKTCITLFTIMSLGTFAQTKSIKNSPKLSEDTPASVGMSGERLARIDNMLNKAVADSEIPGAIALVARHGKIVYLKAFGSFYWIISIVESIRKRNPFSVFFGLNGYQSVGF